MWNIGGHKVTCVLVSSIPSHEQELAYESFFSIIFHHLLHQPIISVEHVLQSFHNINEKPQCSTSPLMKLNTIRGEYPSTPASVSCARNRDVSA